MNPILQALNMTRPNNNMIGLLSALKGGNPEMMFRQMMNSNPQFRQFVEQNKDKSPEQIAQEYGVDINLLQQFIK